MTSGKKVFDREHFEYMFKKMLLRMVKLEERNNIMPRFSSSLTKLAG